MKLGRPSCVRQLADCGGAKEVIIMESMMRECLKPHALLHTVTGVGLGIILMSFFPYTPLDTVRFMGVALVGVAVLGEFVVNKPTKKRR